MTRRLERGQPFDHQAYHRDVNHRFAAAGELLVVFAEPTVAAEPTKGPLNDPAARQDNKPFHIVTSLDNLQTDLSLCAKITNPVYQSTGVAAVGPNQSESREGIPHDIENKLRAIPVLNAGGVYDDRKNQTQDIDKEMPFAAVHLLARVVAAGPPFSVVSTDCESMMAALG